MNSGESMQYLEVNKNIASGQNHEKPIIMNIKPCFFINIFENNPKSIDQ